MLLALAANAKDPVMILAANGFIELGSNDASLPDLILRSVRSQRPIRFQEELLALVNRFEGIQPVTRMELVYCAWDE